MRAHFLIVLAPLTFFAACGDDDAAPTPVTGGSLDASTHPSDSGSSSSGSSSGSGSSSSSGGEDAGPCVEAHYVNGTLAGPSAGKASFHSENNIDAQVVVATGTIDCTATFDAAGGVMVGSAMSGALDIQCDGTEEDQYYGFHLHTLGKPASGTEYKIGKAGLDGAALNNQFDFTWETGSRCGAKNASLREWVGGPSALLGHGVMYVEDVTGNQLKVRTSLTEMTLSPNNVAGKGTFSGQVSNATLTVTGL